MDRAKATRQLVRIIEAIEAEAFPTRIKELHVFGSYARGALNPGDLDLILIHYPAPPEVMEEIKRSITQKYGHHSITWLPVTWPDRKFETIMRRVMRRPGEKMDIILGTTLKEALRYHQTIAASKIISLWSEQNPNWQQRLSAIKQNKDAGRYARGHFAEARRFNSRLGYMTAVSKLIKSKVFKLTRIDAERTTPDLNSLYQHWYDHWVDCSVMGKDSMKLLMHGMWWMQHQRGQAWEKPSIWGHDNVLWSGDSRYVAYFGHPSLHHLYRLTEVENRVVRMCMIPHFKRGKPNLLYVLERGRRFSEKRFMAIWKHR